MAAKKPEKPATRKSTPAAKAGAKVAQVGSRRGRAEDAAKPAGTVRKAAATKPKKAVVKLSTPEPHEKARPKAAKKAEITAAVKTIVKTPVKDTVVAAAKAPPPAPPRRRPTRPAREIYSPATGTNTADPFPKRELEKFRQLIVDIRSESIEELEMLTEQLREMTASEVGDDNNAYSLHMAEQGTDAMEREKTFLQAQRTSDYVKKLGESLERIDNGSFGLCRICGLRLDSKRLMAVPVTQVCTVYKNTSKPCEPGRLHMQQLGINEEDLGG